MRCPACSHQNEEGQSFCVKCAAELLPGAAHDFEPPRARERRYRQVQAVGQRIERGWADLGYEWVRLRPDRPGYVANASVYTSYGRLVKQLVRNELVSSDDTFSWDGITDENTKAPIGIYIVRIDLFTPDGVVKHFMKPTVLGGRF